MQQPTLNPTPDQTCELLGEGPYNFARILAHSHELEAAGAIERACNERFAAFQRLVEFLPDDEDIVLEWNHRNARAALELIHASAIDHFLIDDFELSAALLEMLLELDPEDHLEGIVLLAFNYLAMDERELFDEVIGDISDKEAVHDVLLLWSAFLRNGTLDKEHLHRFKTRFAPFFAEFTADGHPADEAYLRDIDSEHPSQQALARQLWLQTEHLWRHHPAFIEALRS